MKCQVCRQTMKKGLRKWHFVCKNCKHESAVFRDEINTDHAEANLDEGLRLDALQDIRQSNFNEITNILKEKGFDFKKKEGT